MKINESMRKTIQVQLFKIIRTEKLREIVMKTIGVKLKLNSEVVQLGLVLEITDCFVDNC